LGGCQKANGEEAMMEGIKLPEPQRSDWFIEKLGKSQQKVMSLTVENRALKKKLEKRDERADALASLVMDVVIDLRGNVLKSAIQERIAKVMRRLDADG
jgi:hypothetical protein